MYKVNKHNTIDSKSKTILICGFLHISDDNRNNGLTHGKQHANTQADTVYTKPKERDIELDR
jgi:hypothetical protein